MIYAAALLSAAFFSFGLVYLGVVHTAAGAITASRGAANAFGDRTLDDKEKERLARAAAVSLLTSTLSIVVRAAVALGVALLPPAIFDAIGFVEFSEVMRWIASWPGIASTTAAIAIACAATARRPG